MPKQNLVGNSVLLSRHGWRRVGTESKECVTVGVDRSGRLAEMPLRIQPVGETSQFAFIGSKRVFGAFHLDTRLIDANGIVRSVAQLVLDGEIGDLRFENVTELDEFSFGQDDPERIWLELQEWAEFKNDKRLVLLARGVLPGSQDDWWSLLGLTRLFDQEDSAHSYLCLEKDRLSRALNHRPGDVLNKLIMARFEVTEEGAVVIDRDEFIWCLWLLLFFDQSRRGEIELTYDNLQHSTVVTVAPKTSRSSQVLNKGACAFLRSQIVASYEIEWDDTSWSPISSGFILPAS